MNEDGIRVEEVRPNVWPLAIYNAHHAAEAHVDSVRKLVYKGKSMQGVYVPDDGKPLPVGVLKMTNLSNNAVQKKQTVERRHQQWAENQAEDTRQSLIKKALSTAGPSVKATESFTKRDAPMEAIPDSTDSDTEEKPKNKKCKREDDDSGDDSTANGLEIRISRRQPR